MNTAVVLGRGFGLYGHAAALGRLGWRVLLPADYRDVVASRSELSDVSGNFEYVNDIAKAASASHLICLSRRPADNGEILLKLVDAGIHGSLIVEKPLATDATQSLALLSLLSEKALRFSTPYLFLYTDWFLPLRKAVNAGIHCKIQWVHRQAANLNGWKQDVRSGGGVLAFYLIHALSLFRALDMPLDAVEKSGDRWLLKGQALSLLFRLGAETHFCVEAARERLFKGDSPFGTVPLAGETDPRVTPLMRFYRSVEESAGSTHSLAFHHEIFTDWLRAEKVQCHTN